MSSIAKVRRLVVVLGDQLDARAGAFEDFDDEVDAVLMMEVDEEATYVPQHKLRIAAFFAAMRHFRDELRAKGKRVLYAEVDDRNNRGSLSEELRRWVHKARPERVMMTEPGDWRVADVLRRTAHELDTPLEVVPDRHFLCSREHFTEYAEGRRSLLLEHFYRHMRRQLGVLLDDGDPVGGRWNFDRDNRQAFGREGPPPFKAPRSFSPDDTTSEVLALVEKRFPDSPGRLGCFDLPVTHRQARAALRDFVGHRLEHFGTYQDAMAAGRPYLAHSRLSCALNLHLLRPAEVVDAVLEAHAEQRAPLNAVEGFVRQIIGWREFVRGIYWLHMPDYAELNALEADLPVPGFMWTADTDMRCVRSCVTQLIEHAYTHHIQRLMVLGLVCLLLGVHPYEVHRWHMSMYADAIDWVSLPNVLGMSQYADGGVVGTKPYCASGNYISRMSDYCDGCRYDPKKAEGEDACPFTTLYWDFLARHRARLGKLQRMRMQLHNLERKPRNELVRIRRRAGRLKTELAG